MRLINTRTLIQREFNGEPGRDIPPYAILSHTWSEDEVSYREFAEGASLERQETAGYLKIKNCCSVARQLGISWAWVDTCCIDKTSSAELSEAINSMFTWYAKSRVCLAYLSDFHDSAAFAKNRYHFSGSRWFTRGWTLQELLAPGAVSFYDSQWRFFGDKVSLKADVADASKINAAALTDTSGDWEKYSIAERFFWAAHRRTTRVEDEAYSLMGLFGVNMPLLYGEGSQAFLRLQTEIIQQSSDQSIYAWTQMSNGQKSSGFLAPAVRCFKHQPVVGEKADAQTTEGSRSAHKTYTPTRDMVQELLEGYVNQFQLAGNTLSIDQLKIGPVSKIYVEDASHDASHEIPLVTILHQKGEMSPIIAPSSSSLRLHEHARALWGRHPDPLKKWETFDDDLDVYIMPLLCAVRGDSLCVLLSRPKPRSSSSSAAPFRRLHSPSLVRLHPSYLQYLKRPKDRVHAYMRCSATTAFAHGNSIDFTVRRATRLLEQQPGRLGYPCVDVGPMLESGYHAFSMYITSDGTLSDQLPENDVTAKHVVTFLSRNAVNNDPRLLPPATLTPNASVYGFQQPSISIALYGDCISVATFEKRSEPVISRFPHADSLPSSLFDPDTNPFIGMAGLLETSVFDVWTLVRVYVRQLAKESFILESNVVDNARVITVYSMINVFIHTLNG